MPNVELYHVFRTTEDLLPASVQMRAVIGVGVVCASGKPSLAESCHVRNSPERAPSALFGRKLLTGGYGRGSTAWAVDRLRLAM
jgi:hypothetical protein